MTTGHYLIKNDHWSFDTTNAILMPQRVRIPNFAVKSLRIIKIFPLKQGNFLFTHPVHSFSNVKIFLVKFTYVKLDFR